MMPTTAEEIECATLEYLIAGIEPTGPPTADSVSVCATATSPPLRGIRNVEIMASTDTDTSVDPSSTEAPSESSAGGDVLLQSEPQAGLDTDDSPQAGATEDPPARRKRPRHPRARGGRRIQEAKARKAARIAAQEAAAAEAARLATGVEVAGAPAETEADAACDLVEAETVRAIPEVEAAAQAQPARTLAESARAASEAEAEIARAVSGEEATASEVLNASPAVPEVLSMNGCRPRLANGLEAAVDPKAKKRRHRQRRNRLNPNSGAVRPASASSDAEDTGVGAEDAGSGSAGPSCEITLFSSSISTSSSLDSLRILSQPSTPPLGFLRAWPSEPFLETEDADVAEEDVPDRGHALPCFGPLEEPLSSEQSRHETTIPLEACTLAHASLPRLPEQKYGQLIAAAVNEADATGLCPIPEYQDATGSKIQFTVAPSPPLSGPLCLPHPDALDTSLASNAHRGSRLALPIATLRSAACPAPRPQLSQSHYALLQTLFPAGDPGTPRIHRVSEPLPAQTDSSAASEALADPPLDTLAHDLLATQKEISGLKGSMETLLARMNDARSAHSSGTSTSRAREDSEEARGVRVLRSLMKDMERVLLLTDRLAAAVQSDMAPSV